jgi:hypothetical protein
MPNGYRLLHKKEIELKAIKKDTVIQPMAIAKRIKSIFRMIDRDNAL